MSQGPADDSITPDPLPDPAEGGGVSPDRGEPHVPQAPLPRPPAGSGVVVEETPRGRRIILPRLYTRADLIVTGMAAAVALWLAVWVDDLAADHPRPSTPGLVAMALVGLAFGVVAVSQGVRILARPVLEEHPDHLVVGRRLGARTVLKRSVAKADIEAADRIRDPEAVSADAAGVVRLRTRTGDHLLCRGLDPETLAWLEAAVRRM
ncbi:MAG: hypothetical protein ACOCVZ_05540 [Gemmatimonadota bacterium]